MKITIVGAGLFGIVLAHELSRMDFDILLIDKRDHIGGNCYDYLDDNTGILIHKYGPHILHINDEKIYRYITKFCKFNNYKHQVRALYNDKIYEFPINLSTINNFYNVNLHPYEVLDFLSSEARKDSVPNPQNMEEKVISLIGRPLYEAFFKEYTTKQWGKNPAQLPASIINRIPIKCNYDTNYYKKSFNGMPSEGYTKLFEKMLQSKKISIQLNTDFFHDRDYFLKYDLLVYTGPIDAFFGYEHGKLEYRSLRFEEELHYVDDWQGNSVINYPELKYSYTRICEPKHFYPERWNSCSKNKTLIFKEISFSNSSGDPYYPILDKNNMEIYRKYKNDSLLYDNIYFGGRLGEYKYYDMEDTIKSALKLSTKILMKYTGR